MNLAARNARALSAGQFAWDNAEPPCDDGREEYIEAQLEELMRTGECDQVKFYTKKRGVIVEYGFADAAFEAICEADTSDQELVQLVMACLNGEHDKAAKLASYFEDALRGVAEKMITESMEDAA